MNSRLALCGNRTRRPQIEDIHFNQCTGTTLLYNVYELYNLITVYSDEIVSLVSNFDLSVYFVGLGF